jgi:5'-nucleotidase
MRLAACTLLIAFASTMAAAAEPFGKGAGKGVETVQLLAINDLHGRLEPPGGDEGLVGAVQTGGIEYLATHLRRDMAKQPASLVVGAGDLFGDSPALSARFDEAPTIEALNALSMTVSALGNHELDAGAEALGLAMLGRCKSSVCAGPSRQPARFGYLAANVISERTGQPLLPSTRVVSVGSVKVGFIGVVLEGAGQHLSPEAVQGLRFESESQAANVQALALRQQGVRAIVLLIHQGGHQGGDPLTADPNGCSGFEGDLKPILRRLSSSIGVVVSGHTHRAYTCRIDGRLVTSAGSYGRIYTRIQLDIDRGSGRIVGTRACNELVTRDVPRDPAETAVLSKYQMAGGAP